MLWKLFKYFFYEVKTWGKANDSFSDIADDYCPRLFFNHQLQRKQGKGIQIFKRKTQTEVFLYQKQKIFTMYLLVFLDYITL